MDDHPVIFTKLRRDIETARRLLLEREQALDEAEAALQRLRVLFGIGRRAAQDARGWHSYCLGTLRRF